MIKFLSSRETNNHEDGERWLFTCSKLGYGQLKLTARYRQCGLDPSRTPATATKPQEYQNMLLLCIHLWVHTVGNFFFPKNTCKCSPC